MRQMTTFSVGPLWLGIDVADVREVVAAQEMTPIPLARDGVVGLINLRGEVVTAIDLRARLGLPPRERDDESGADADVMNVVVTVDGEPISLLVDSIGDVADVSDDDFERPPLTVPASMREFMHGAFKQPTGLLLLLDVAGAVESRSSGELRAISVP